MLFMWESFCRDQMEDIHPGTGGGTGLDWNQESTPFIRDRALAMSSWSALDAISGPEH